MQVQFEIKCSWFSGASSCLGHSPFTTLGVMGIDAVDEGPAGIEEAARGLKAVVACDHFSHPAPEIFSRIDFLCPILLVSVGMIYTGS